MTQPFQGCSRSPCRPRVASPQPWADIRSPLGQKSALPNPGTLKPEEPFILTGIKIVLDSDSGVIGPGSVDILSKSLYLICLFPARLYK